MKSEAPQKRRPLFGHQETSRKSFNHVSTYNNFQSTEQREKPQPQPPPVIIRGFIFDYCQNTSLHGMKYIAQRDRRWYERWVLQCRAER